MTKRDTRSRDTDTPDPIPPSEVPWARRAMTMLTVLYHPRVERIGEVAVLASLDDDGIGTLSRNHPTFAPPGDRDASETLLDPFVSRSPVKLTRSGSRIRLLPSASGRVSVDGEPLEAPREIGEEALERGVVIVLGRRVVVLLHRTKVHNPFGKRVRIPGLVGESVPIRALCSRIIRVGRFDVPVLIVGESGSGKERVARAVHTHSQRVDGPFVSINMAAISPELASSALFGHAKGAFTGAASASDGYFGAADGGTLFMDEIGDTPEAIQPALLRVLETGELQRPGVAQAPTVDVRVVAATDVNLRAAVDRGDFKRGLLHRLAGYRLDVPPLRDRRADIGRLLMTFVREELEAVDRLDKLELERSRDWPWLSAELVGRLCRYHWPGNVRELKNVARRIVISSVDRDHVDVDEVLELLVTDPAARRRGPRGATAGTTAISPSSDGSAESAPSEGHSGGGPVELSEAEVKQALKAHAFRVSATARALGISRTTLYALMEKYPGIRKASDLTETEITAAVDDCNGDLRRAAAQLEVSSHALKMRMSELAE